MRRFATIAALALALAGSSAAGQELSLGTGSADQGETVEIPLTYVGNGAVVALQVDVSFDADVLGAPTATGGAALGGHVLRSAEVSPGRFRMVVYSPGNAALGNGMLARLSFSVKDDAPVGSSALAFSAAVLGNAAAVRVTPASLTSGSVTVTSASTLGVESFGTVADTGDGVLEEGEVARAPITQLLVGFTEPVQDPAGHNQSGDVTNPASYLLVAAGADGVFQTTNCAAGVAAGDAAVAVGSVAYNAVSATAVLSVGNGFALPHGSYRLLVCDSIVGAGGASFEGDIGRTFHVVPTNLLANPNFDSSLAGWIPVSPGVNEIRHAQGDSDGAPTSGSAEIMNLSGDGEVFSLAECVALTATGSYGLGGRVWLDSARPDAPSCYAVVDFHAGPGCTGGVLGTGITPGITGDTQGEWRSLSGFVAAPAGAVSARVMFVLDAGTSPDFAAGLDQLLFHRDEIFGDGFESGSTGPWQRTPD